MILEQKIKTNQGRKGIRSASHRVAFNKILL